MPVPGRRSRVFYLRRQVNSALEAGMIVLKYILLFTCLGIGLALCVGVISILRSPPDNGPAAWFAAAFGAMFFWGAFALVRWRLQQHLQQHPNACAIGSKARMDRGAARVRF